MPTVEERLAILEEKEEETTVARANKIPFHLEIQLKKNKVTLRRVERTQKWTFEKILRKDNNRKLPDDWKDEFCLFWAGFLKGEYKSINQYLRRLNYNTDSPVSTPGSP